MNMKLFTLTCAALAASLAVASPALAQESSYTPGGYADVSAIDVLDGQMDAYMDYLAGSWKRQQEWAKSKGYIQSYSVLANPYPRAGEPDLYLVINYSKIYDTAEEMRQQKEFEAFMKADSRQLGAQYADRGKMRKSLGQQQLRQINLK
jgi:hypothetical protein